jgi:phenylalanyl-tRNA synthetase alpha chain
LLGNNEKRVLQALLDESDLERVAEKAVLEEVAVMRSYLVLRNENLVEMSEKVYRLIEITEEGLKLLQELPERMVLSQIGGGVYLEDLKIDASILSIAMGWLLKRKWIIMEKRNDKTFLKITSLGLNFLTQKTEEEMILEKLEKNPINELIILDDFNPNVLSTLKQRQAIRTIEKKERTINLTDLGRAIAQQLIQQGFTPKEEVSQLTPSLIASGQWKNVDLKRFDIRAEVSPISPGKRHFENQAIEYIRRIWLELGFEEMQGPIVNTAFWNFDALFTPQDHPARELQDTFYVRGKRGDLPDRLLVRRVSDMHERGGGIADGWGYEWNEEEARKLVPRPHTTVLSARTLASLKKEDLPKKFFSVGKCFRNEQIDWNHLAEFYQTDGIVVSENVNFRHLLGYLERFLNKMGHTKIRFRPAYFPYTEPSVEAEVYNEERGVWMELVGAGIFRPEVTVPLLGHDIPVLAWGPGFGRIIMEYYGLTDIRDLYRNDIEQLRTMKLWRW